jgi:hypothetical protein
MGRYVWIAINQKEVMISKGPFEDPCIYQYLPGLPKFFIGTHNGLHLAQSMNSPLHFFIITFLSSIFFFIAHKFFYIGLEVKSNNNLANNKILVDEMVKAVGKIFTAVDEILAIHRSTLKLALLEPVIT